MKLIVEPRIVKTWQSFIVEAPKYSIALDGYVKGKPMYDPSGPFANFNHHEEVDRLATRSTCGQVYVAVRQGLMDAYRINGRFS